MGITATIVGGVVGGGTQAFAQQQAGIANQRIADYNADALDAQARDAIERGDQQSNVRRVEGRLTVGTQRAAFASQGVLVDNGSAADVVYDTLNRTDQDVATIKTNAALQAWGYQTQSRISRYQGRIAHRQGNLAAISTLIGSASKAGSDGAKAGSGGGGGASSGASASTITTV